MRRSMIIVAPFALVCVAVLLIPAARAAEKGQSVTISGELEFTETSGASDKVKAECTLQTRLPQFIKDSAKKMHVVLAKDVSDSTEPWASKPPRCSGFRSVTRLNRLP